MTPPCPFRLCRTACPVVPQLVSELDELLEAADELQAERDAALGLGAGRGSRCGLGGGAAEGEEGLELEAAEDPAAASTWAAAAALALLE